MLFGDHAEEEATSPQGGIGENNTIRFFTYTTVSLETIKIGQFGESPERHHRATDRAKASSVAYGDGQ